MTTAIPYVSAQEASADLHQPARTDSRPRARRMLAPVLVGLGSAIALGYLYAVDPNQPGHYPLCPLKAIFHVDCPGCGMMRGTHDLLHGQVGSALDHNVLLAVLAPGALIAWVVWMWRSWTGRHPAVTAAQWRARSRWLVVATVVLLVFGVVRNFVPYLGSGIG